MRHTAPKPVSSLRLARLTLWARLWLERLVAVLRALTGEESIAWIEPFMRLEDMRRTVAWLVLLHAAARVTVKPPRRIFHPSEQSGGRLMRATLGADLRRALRRAGVMELIAILRAPEELIARLARRLRRGFARRRRTFRARPRRIDLGCALLTPAASGADTS